MTTFIFAVLVVYLACNLLLLGLTTVLLNGFHEKPPKHFTLMMVLFGVFVVTWSVIMPRKEKEFEIK